ncbi:MAG TPA: NAD(P)H-binding protein [Pyrinomonadaceae bacterium]|jgi:uncharacterized protein YbjT (DUF2867 family)
MRVLITGGTGLLGRALVRTAVGAGHAVRVLSRRARAAADGFEYAVGDVASGAGLDAALSGVEAIIHAASDPRRPEEVDVGGTRRLVEAACTAGVAHLVYVSIVGIDRIPVRYYRTKLEAEGIVAASGLPHTVLRATQFHAFVAWLISGAARVPFVLPLPAGFKFQPVDEAEVAEQLVRCLGEGPRGRADDFGGPEVLSLEEMAEAWMEATGVRKRMLRLPVPGALAAALRGGANTAPDGERGSVSWREWLARNVGRARGPAGRQQESPRPASG